MEERYFQVYGVSKNYVYYVYCVYLVNCTEKKGNASSSFFGYTWYT